MVGRFACKEGGGCCLGSEMERVYDKLELVNKNV